MNQALSQIQRQTQDTGEISEFHTAVSLHSHTYHSKENLGSLPRYIDFHRTPVLRRLLQSNLRRYEARHGKALDFGRAYWTPPVTPRMVLESEMAQIENELGLAALVSITDHDTIAGPLSLREQPATAGMPVSVEWTIPFADNSLHLGVHHLPPDRAVTVMKELARYTKEPVEERLSDLFALLDSFPDTLLVLNHPFHNIYRVPGTVHLTSVRQLLGLCRPWIHALEVNGMRSWSENQDVLTMAEEYDLPIVAGGDRHGCHTNTLLNLSQAKTWGDFVAGIRSERRNTVLVLRSYEEPAPLRELATACDALRNYPRYPRGRRRYTDRVFADVEGFGWHPLSFYWDAGGKGTRPLWLAPIVAAVITLGSDPVRPLLRRLLSRAQQFDRAQSRAEGEADCDREGLRARTEVGRE